MTTHQVRRANFRLKLAQAPDAGQQQHWQREFVQRYLPLLDKALALWLEERPHLRDRMVQIPRLQLDLGKLDAGVDDEVVVRSLQQQLDRNLPGLLGMDADSWRLQCYLHFLRHGAWPIGSTFTRVAEVEQWLTTQPTPRQRLLAHLQGCVKDSVIWQRLLQQHTEYFLGWLATRTPSLLPAEFATAIDAISGHRGFKAAFSLWLNLWWQHRGKALYSAQPELSSALQALLSLATSDPPPPLSQLLPRIDQLSHFHRGQSDEASGDEGESASHDTETQLQTGILVQQAGVILLHPFLPRLFEALGLLGGSRFRSDDCRLQAVFALHYVATGRQHADEGELALHKFLVHWPLDHPVPPTLALAAEQYSEIDHMIGAAISQWRVLKNTSIAGLRETFLQRSGSLQKLDEGHRLAVAARSVDILLAQLPWTLSLVKLPWLEQPLFVYWGQP